MFHQYANLCSLCRINGAVLLKDTKNGKPRLVPLNRIALAAIERMDYSVRYDVIAAGV